MPEQKNNSKGKVLLAEDDKFISKAYIDGLKRAGFEVFHAHDGNEALKIAKKEKPDIILLDVIMPDKNGFEALSEIKSDKDISRIPVFVLSNLSQNTDIEKGKSLGAADYLVKSDYSISEVVKKINKAIRQDKTNGHIQ